MSKLGAIAAATAATIQPAVKAAPVNTENNVKSTPVNSTDKSVVETTKVEVKPELKPWETVKHKIKVNDSEQELSYTELLERAQKGVGADSRFQEAAAMRKQAESALKLLKTDPTQAFKLLDVDPKSWAAKYLEEAAYEAMLSPQEKEARDEKAKMTEQIRELEALKKEKSDARQKEVMDKVFGDLQEQVISALKISGLPQIKEVVKRIAQKMLVWREAGHTNVTAKDVIADVKQEYQDDLRAMLGGVEEDQLEAFLGDDTVKKLINRRNQSIQEKNSPFKAKAKGTKVKSKTPEEPRTYKGNEWRRELQEKFKK